MNISYDGIGNPLSDGTWTYTWEHGRQLASMAKADGTATWTYTYNTDGLRTKRTDGTNTYEYVYYGGLLQYMEYNNTPVYFTHAPDGTPMGMLTGGKAYFYITNLQGDVTGIVDQTGNLVVSYTYDAWGNPLSTTLADGNTYAATVAALNPIRYRGYVYDTETDLYYLQSRYYDPERGRFINADIFISTGQGLTSQNMFAYCGNNPILRVDDGGGYWHIVIGAIVGAILNGAAKSVANLLDDDPETDWSDGLGLPIITGAVTGGFYVSGAGPAVQVFVNAGCTAIEEFPDTLEKLSKGENILETLGDYVFDIGLSAITSYGSGLGSKAITNMGKQTVKRVYNAFLHDGFQSGVSEICKAAKWYWKSAKKTISKNFIDQAKGFLNNYVDDTIIDLFRQMKGG